MKNLTILVLLPPLILTGCLITGSAQYTDPETGATANLGVSHEFKPKPKMRADGKRIIPRE